MRVKKPVDFSLTTGPKKFCQGNGTITAHRQGGLHIVVGHHGGLHVLVHRAPPELLQGSRGRES
eukprot:5959552-Pyramimonas_sp.AAC.1